MLSAWVVLALELAVVAVAESRRIAGVWELESGSLWLAPTALLAAGLLGVLGALALELVERSTRPWARSALAALGFLLAFAVAYGVGGGRHLAALEKRLGFAAVVGAAGAAAMFFAVPRAARALERPRAVFALLAALAILGLELANRFVLPRLYPAFHLGLAGLTLLLAPFCAALALGRKPAGQRPRSAFALLALALALPAAALAPSAERLARFDNFRFVLLEQAPLLGRAVELAARVAPPAPWDAPGGCPGSGCGAEHAVARSGLGALDLRGRDVLLVTIDALRADHVGAYGYSRPTTPELDRLASGGAVFERAYTATPHTSYAITSLMTGKYLRPLLLQGTGADSDTWASLLRTYGYRTAAFYPPAVFFIDGDRFEPFRKTALGFEYSKIEFAEGDLRVAQFTDYLAATPSGVPVFLWVHLFGPHEPYVEQPGHAFGERDLDRYDSEIAAADATLGRLVAEFRRRRPKGVVIATADHGEEFGEHGGRYHGTTVYEEQLRVPLVISAPGAVAPRRVREVVQTIDLLPTVLAALDVPRPPRIRGRDLSPLLAGRRADEPGLAHGETDEQTLLARGDLRLVCARRVGACRLYDLARDPAQQLDVAGERRAELDELRGALQKLTASHGRYETQGLRAEGKGWPPAIVRGLAGDADATAEIATLLDDVDPQIRRKAAEILVDLRARSAAPALRLALSRDEDPEVRELAALALTRLGEGAPLVLELLAGSDVGKSRLAALALAESGDRRGVGVLLGWWKDAKQRDFQRSREILAALAGLRVKDAVPLFTESLDDVRLRPELARALAKIGDESARPPLVRALSEERSQSARQVLFEALVELGGKEDLVPPLVRFLGVPDPVPNGLSIALAADVLRYVGGPQLKELPRLRARSDLGTRFRVVVPRGGNGRGVRAIVRAACPPPVGRGDLLIGSAAHLVRYDRSGKLVPQRGVPELDAERALRFAVPCRGEPVELFAPLPASMPTRPGASTDLILYASRDVRIEAVALVPLADELPPPAPKPWMP